ncbi:MAG: hypothetical protein WDN50_08055 [Bradyrhizobium sp.]
MLLFDFVAGFRSHPAAKRCRSISRDRAATLFCEFAGDVPAEAIALREIAVDDTPDAQKCIRTVDKGSARPQQPQFLSPRLHTGLTDRGMKIN